MAADARGVVAQRRLHVVTAGRPRDGDQRTAGAVDIGDDVVPSVVVQIDVANVAERPVVGERPGSHRDVVAGTEESPAVGKIGQRHRTPDTGVVHREAAFGGRVGNVGRPVERDRPAPETLARHARRCEAAAHVAQRLEVLARGRQALQLRPGCVRPREAGRRGGPTCCRHRAARPGVATSWSSSPDQASIRREPRSGAARAPTPTTDGHPAAPAAKGSRSPASSRCRPPPASAAPAPAAMIRS
jgi:hypothetical protein